MHRARLEDRVFGVAGLVGGARQIEAVALARAHPAVARDDDRERLVDHLALERRAPRFFDHGAALVAVFLRVVPDLFRDELFHLGVAAEQRLQLLALDLELFQLGLDLDAFQARELAQPDLEDVLGLDVGQLEALHQLGLGLVRLADDLDHLVDVQEDDVAAFEDVDAPLDLREPEFRAPRDRRDAELRPTRRASRGCSCAPGRPSRPSTTRFTGKFSSRLVCASMSRMNSSGSWREERGSSTSRTLLSLSDSSFTFSSTPRISCFRFACVGADLAAFLLGLGIGELLDLGHHAMRRGRRRQLVTMTCHWPRARFSTFQRQRARSEPRPLV